MVFGIFLAVDRCHVRGISVEIGAGDTKLLAVIIDPFPEDVAWKTNRCARVAPLTLTIRCKPVTIASAEAASMVRSVVGRL